MPEVNDQNLIKALENYDKAIAACPTIERKGKTTPYTSVNGHMFSFLSKEGTMGLRLSESDRNEYIQKFKTGLMIQHGRVMKEYVEIPNNLLVDTENLVSYVKKSFEYVSKLTPKPSKKKK